MKASRYFLRESWRVGIAPAECKSSVFSLSFSLLAKGRRNALYFSKIALIDEKCSTATRIRPPFLYGLYFQAARTDIFAEYYPSENCWSCSDFPIIRYGFLSKVFYPPVNLQDKRLLIIYVVCTLFFLVKDRRRIFPAASPYRNANVVNKFLYNDANTANSDKNYPIRDSRVGT